MSGGNITFSRESSTLQFKMDAVDNETIPFRCEDFVEQFTSDEAPKSLTSCDFYLERINKEIENRLNWIRKLQLQNKDLTSQQYWFGEERKKYCNASPTTVQPGQQVASPKSTISDEENSSKQNGSNRKYGSLKSTDGSDEEDDGYSKPNESTEKMIGPLKSNEVTYGEVNKNRKKKIAPLVSNDGDPHGKETVPFTPVTDDNPYNVREQLEPDQDPYSSTDAKHSNDPWYGLQCIVVKDFTAEDQSEIDLYENDWVELQAIRGGRYYGQVFGRRGKKQGWFLRDFVDVIPGSKVGSLVFRFVVEAKLDYHNSEEGFFSFKAGDKFDVLQTSVKVDSDRKHEYYRVRDINGKIGLVVGFCFEKCNDEDPVLFSQQCYHANCSRDAAEGMLRLHDVPESSYLLRDSGNALGNFAISVKGSDRVFHIMVITHEKGYRVRHKSFDSLVDIFDFHRATPVTRQLLLSHPLEREGDHKYVNVSAAERF